MEFVLVISLSESYTADELENVHLDRDWQTIKVVNPHYVFSDFDREFKMKQDHQEHVTVPPHFIHLGTSVICENEAMCHPSKKMISVQFHPEVSDENGNKFFDRLIRDFGLINN